MLLVNARKGEADKDRVNRVKVVGVRIDLDRGVANGGRRGLANRLGVADGRPGAAVAGHFNLGGVGVGLRGAPGVVHKVDLCLADAERGVEHDGHARRLVVGIVLSVGVVGPDGRVAVRTGGLGLEGGAAVHYGIQVVGLKALGHVLLNAQERAAVVLGEVAAQLDGLVLNADARCHRDVAAKDAGRAGELNRVLLGKRGIFGDVPRDGEVGVDDSAIRHGPRTRLGHVGLLAHRGGGGVVEHSSHVVNHGDDGGYARALNLTGHLEDARLGKKLVGDLIPRDGSGIVGGAVGVVDSHGLGQDQLRSGLHIVIAREEQALHALLGRLLTRGLCLDGDGCTLEAVGAHLDGDVSAGLVGTHDADELAGPGVTVVVTVGLPIGGAAVVHGGKLAGAGDLKLNVVGGVGDDVAVLVEHAHGDVGEIGAVGGNGGAVDGDLELCLVAGGGHALATLPQAGVGGVDPGAVLIVGNGGDGAVRIRDVPGEVEVLVGGAVGVRALVDLIGVVAGAGGLLGEGLLAQGLRLAAVGRGEEELDLRGVGVDDHGHVAAGVLGDHVLVPRRQDVQRMELIVPLALIEVIGVLGQARGIDDAEVGVLGTRPVGDAVGLAGGGAVPGRGLAEVVKAGPHVLAHDIVKADGVVPRLGGEVAPAHAGDVVGGELLTGHVGGVVSHRVVDATAVGGRNGLGAVENPAGVVLVHRLVTAAERVVDTDDAAVVGQVIGLIVPRAA